MECWVCILMIGEIRTIKLDGLTIGINGGIRREITSKFIGFIPVN
jgi:hypothetical protein